MRRSASPQGNWHWTAVSPNRRRAVADWAVAQAAGTDAFPHLQAMDRHLGIDLEAQTHTRATNLQDRDLEQTLEALAPAHHHGFLTFPRQDQHARTSFFSAERLIRSRSGIRRDAAAEQEHLH